MSILNILIFSIFTFLALGQVIWKKCPDNPSKCDENDKTL